MATTSSLLRDHVPLSVRSVDRVFMHAYVPGLMTKSQVIRFLLHRGYPIPSPAAHLGSGIDGAQVLGEAPDDAQALPLADGAAGRPGLGPGERPLGGDDRGARAVEPGGETAEDGVVARKLVAQRSAERQVLLDFVLQGAHPVAPGHG